jgi:phosphatidylglycerophosphate synthase
MTFPDWISAARLGLVVVLWPVALSGHNQIVGIGLVVAAVSDAVDGYLARRMRSASVRGARLDAIADSVLMLSTGAWIAILHPTLVAGGWPLLATAGVLYASSTAASYLAFGRLVDPRQLTAKLAGGLLYGFALLTLLTGAYEPLLLTVALAALAIACVEGLAKAIRTIHVRGIVSSARSHTPQPSKGVARSRAASASIATSAAPANQQSAP